MIVLRTEREIDQLRQVGRITGLARREARRLVRVGITTQALSEAVERVIRAQGAEPNFLGYHGFPAAVCTSINEQVVHGIPGPRVLREGDVVSVDLGAQLNGYHGDTAFTVALGEVPDRVKELIQVTEEALELAIRQCVPGRHLSDISHAVEAHVTRHGFGVVREYVGHGIGRALHEDPQLPNYGPPGEAPILSTPWRWGIPRRCSPWSPKKMSEPQALDLQPGDVVRSLAGRDRGTIGVVWGLISARRVAVVDGEVHPVSRPKPKNRRHLERLASDPVLAERIAHGRSLSDAELRSLLAPYRASPQADPQDAERR
jgi:methionyl aminopeptidase